MSNYKSTSVLGSSGTGYTTSYAAKVPTYAYTLDDIEFWGAGKDKLDLFPFEIDETDLLINCTGAAWNLLPFVRSQPDGMELPLTGKFSPPQVVLDWKDMSPPPSFARMSFWESFYETIKARGTKRVVVCCGAGQGRTGTALTAFLLLHHSRMNPEAEPHEIFSEMLHLVRENYSQRAVETKGQVEYLLELLQPYEEYYEEDVEEIFLRFGFTKKPLVYSGTGSKGLPAVGKGAANYRSWDDGDDGYDFDLDEDTKEIPKGSFSNLGSGGKGKGN